MSAGGICSRVVYTATPDEFVSEAAERMKRHRVGALPVMDEEGRAVGIVTDRDIALRCVGERLDPRSTRVSEVMTTPVSSVEENTPIEAALSTMAATHARRVVVIDETGKLVGLLALDDVLELLVDEADTIARLLRAQAPL